ncbi:MAG: hypothetical protein HQM12_16190 [SAR324 cluster bacterium]|nr:hypothetical protein [SAR324 cluster bacterium]
MTLQLTNPDTMEERERKTRELLPIIRSKLILETPYDIPLWHWSGVLQCKEITERIRLGKSFEDFSPLGVLGGSLYMSASALDLMDKGTEVVHALLREGTPILVLDPHLFQEGEPEILFSYLRKNRWPKKRWPKWEESAIQVFTPCEKELYSLLFRELNISAIIYAFGLYPAYAIRQGACLRLDDSKTHEQSVLDYYHDHSDEILFFAEPHLKKWLKQHQVPTVRGNVIVI